MMEDNLTQEDVENVKKATDKAAKLKVGSKPEDVEKFKKLLESQRLPVEFTDKDFGMGDRELDVRGLSERNYRQLMFRLEVIKADHLRDISQSLADVERLLMLVLRHQGASDVIGEFSDLIEELRAKAGKAN